MNAPVDAVPLTPLSMAILLALAEGERHGYALMQEVEAQTDGALRPGTGTLYAALQRLEDDGMIRRSEGERGADERRRYYAITDVGRDAARAEARRLLRVLRVAARVDIAPDTIPSRAR